MLKITGKNWRLIIMCADVISKFVKGLNNSILGYLKVKNIISVLNNYKEYENSQKEVFKSHEISIARWKEGQERYIKLVFQEIERDKKILDISCGDGIGLSCFKNLQFKNVVGADFEIEKLENAKKVGYEVYYQDFHKLDAFDNEEFDIVYSSHSLEHALHPEKVLKEFNRVLKENGYLYLVLPFPDSGNEKAHCAKYKLGTYKNDGGKKVIKYVEKFGFKLIDKQFDSFREPEIWLKFTKERFYMGI